MAEPLDGPVCQELVNTAGRHRIALEAFRPDGGRHAYYRKIHLFDAQGFGESTFNMPGLSTSPVVFDHGERASA